MKWLTIILLIVIVLLFIISSRYIRKYKERMTNKNKWCILLTTAVNNDESRKKLYIDSITKWLEKTNYDIFVVESSNYSFDELKNERLYVYSFQIEPKNSTTQYEAESILNILEDIKDHPKLEECSHILKVTGRYYLDDIEEVLDSADPDKDFYFQIHRNNNWQNSEYFGIRKELLKPLIEDIKADEKKHFEHKLYEFSVDKDFVHIGPFKNNIARGGDGLVLKDL